MGNKITTWDLRSSDRICRVSECFVSRPSEMSPQRVSICPSPVAQRRDAVSLNRTVTKARTLTICNIFEIISSTTLRWCKILASRLETSTSELISNISFILRADLLQTCMKEGGYLQQVPGLLCCVTLHSHTSQHQRKLKNNRCEIWENYTTINFLIQNLLICSGWQQYGHRLDVGNLKCVQSFGQKIRKAFLKRERASLQDNFKSYLMGVALKILGLRSRYRMFLAMVSLLFLMPEMCLHKNQNSVNFR